MTRPAVITARDVLNGEPVFLTSCDAWTPELAFAEILEPDDFDWRLAFANRLKEVKNPVLRPVHADANGLPTSFAA